MVWRIADTRTKRNSGDYCLYYSIEITLPLSPKPNTMTAAARSLYYFSFYLFGMGIGLMLVPNLVLSIFRLPLTSEVWIRVVGVLAFTIGFYYFNTAAKNNIAFIKLTVPTRIFVFICFTTFAALQYVSPILIAFGAIDLAGAIWTNWALGRK